MRKFSLFFIRRPVATSLIVLGAAFFGAFAYFKLPVSNLPPVGYPVMVVSAFYPGANPETMASAVATPLEEQLIKIPGIKTIISQSSDSFTKIILTFDLKRNIDLITPDIQVALSNAQAYLPRLPFPPTFSKYNPSDRPTMYIAIDSKSLSHGELFDIANKKLFQPLSMLTGVSDVSIWSVSSSIRIKVDPAKMSSCGVTLGDVGSAVYNNTLQAAGGSVTGDYKAFSIKPEGQLTTPEEYNNLIVRYKDGKPIRVSDIGHAYLTPQQENYRLKFYQSSTGELTNPILITISKKPEANIIDLSDNIKKKLAAIGAELPKSLHITVIYDKSKSVISSVNDAKETLLVAFVFVVIVIFLFMGRPANTIIPAIVLPASILLTFLIMYFLGYSIDNLSLLAITVSAGFVVDDSIVVLENSVRHIENGESTLNAVLLSVKEITGSVISMTGAIIIVCAPLMFLGGIIGRTLREFAVTIIIMAACSGILSLTLTPMMNTRLLKPIRGKTSWLQKYNRDLLDKIIRNYSRLLMAFLKRPYLSIVLWSACIAGTLLFYFLVPKTFLPVGDSGLILGSIKMPMGTSQKPVQKYQDEINKVLKKNPDIKDFVTITGMYPGADQSLGTLAITLKQKNSPRTMEQTLRNIRQELAAIPYNLGEIYLAPDTLFALGEEGTSVPDGSLYSYVLTAMSNKQVAKNAKILKKEMRASPEFTDVQSDVKMDLPQLKLKILRDKASSLGVTVSDIQQTLQYAYSLGMVAQFTIGANPYDVILQVRDKYRKGPADLSMLYVRSSLNGKLVPLSTIAEWKQSVGPSTVTHYQQLAAATISFNLAPGISLGDATNKIENLKKKLFPYSASGFFQGRAKQFIAQKKSFVLLIFLVIVLLYIMFGTLYESYVHPITVLTTIPIAAVGGLGALLIFNSQLSLFACVGLLLILGLVTKNSIMIVDFALQKIEIEGMPVIEAVHEACIIRFRPILMTGLTSLIGALPIAIGFGSDATLRRPLGLVIIGGIIAAQIITLFVTPGVFLYMQSFRKKRSLEWTK